MRFTRLFRPAVPLAFPVLLLSCQQFSQVSGQNSKILTEGGPDGERVKIIKSSRPVLLSFKELRSLAENPKPEGKLGVKLDQLLSCLLYTSPSPRDRQKSRMPSSA